MPSSFGKVNTGMTVSLFLHFASDAAALNWSCPLMHLCFRLSLFGFWRCWFLWQRALSIGEGTKRENFQRQATSRKFRFSLFSLLCHTGAIYQSAIFNSVYLCSASAPKGHTQLHCKWCKLQAEKCVFGGISTLGWHLVSEKKKNKKSLLAREGPWTSRMKKESREI